MDYIRKPRAKGLSERCHLFACVPQCLHTLHPIMTVGSSHFSVLCIERTFLWNGIGKVINRFTNSRLCGSLAMVMFYLVLSLIGISLMDFSTVGRPRVRWNREAMKKEHMVPPFSDV